MFISRLTLQFPGIQTTRLKFHIDTIVGSHGFESSAAVSLSELLSFLKLLIQWRCLINPWVFRELIHIIDGSAQKHNIDITQHISENRLLVFLLAFYWVDRLTGAEPTSLSLRVSMPVPCALLCISAFSVVFLVQGFGAHFSSCTYPRWLFMCKKDSQSPYFIVLIYFIIISSQLPWFLAVKSQLPQSNFVCLLPKTLSGESQI